jgi:uncharacterized protein YbjT (DUF2867 family)/predicted ester cyclase
MTELTLVTGATGVAGAEVVRALRDQRRPVRAFVRDPATARRRLGDDVELAAGDFADPASLRAALAGAGALVLSCADDPRRVDWEAAAIGAARAAGVRRVVRLSAIGAAPGSPVPFWDWHGRADERLRESGLPAVILRSSLYMSTAAFAPPAGARVAVVDPADVGAAAAAALAGGHDGREYVLTGPEAIDFPAAALELPPPLQALFAQLRAGVAARPTDAVERLTGRQPRSFAAYMQELNKRVVRRVFEDVIPAGDRDAMRALMAPGFVDHDPLPGQPAGAEAGAYVVDTMHGAHPDLRFAIDDLVAEGDRVTVRWTLRGTNTGPLLGRPPTGRPVELKAIVIFRLAAGRLVERWAGWKPGFAPF